MYIFFFIGFFLFFVSLQFRVFSSLLFSLPLFDAYLESDAE